jgi:hypothetical protein
MMSYYYLILVENKAIGCMSCKEPKRDDELNQPPYRFVLSPPLHKPSTDEQEEGNYMQEKVRAYNQAQTI